MAARGFTLIELLISITIIGVLLVIVMGAFRISINAWEKGEADIETYQRQQIVLQLVKQQLASIQRVEIAREEQAFHYFLGSEHMVEFITDVSLVPGNQYGRIFVKYRVREGGTDEGMSLEIYEAGLALLAGDQSIFEPSEEAYHLLVGNMAEIRFDYLMQEAGAPPKWQQFWDPEAVEADLPLAVRLTFQAEEDAPEVRVVARIMVEPPDS